MTIAEVSRKYDISADTLRYYEKIGLLPTVTRTSSGIRNFSEEDCNWVEFIKCMRMAKLPIEVLSKYIQLFQEGDATIEERKNLLVEQRNILINKLQEMKVTLARLDYKIESYDQTILKKEKKLVRKQA